MKLYFVLSFPSIFNILIKNVCQEFAYFMFVMLMSLLLPVLIMLASYIAIVVVIFRFRKSTFSLLFSFRLT